MRDEGWPEPRSHGQFEPDRADRPSTELRPGGATAMAKKKTIRTIPQERTPMPEQPPARAGAQLRRGRLRLRLEDALREAERCLLCPDEPCVRGCPVGIDIPASSAKITEKDFRGAYDVITDTNLLPAICGRVCPQENQCEGVCTVGDTLEPVAIGRLERFVGDMAIARGLGQRALHRAERLPGRHRRLRARPAWPAPPTWPRPAARSRSTRPSTSPAAC
jgi:hypothetical protein